MESDSSKHINTEMDFTHITTGIKKYIGLWEQKLTELTEEIISTRRNRQNRTIKQILGHLVDSAANNHQRIVRLQYNTELVFPDYQQDNDLWIALQDYQHADWKTTVQLWKYYNLHIIQVIKSVDQTKLDHSWKNFEGNTVTLREMIDGYLDHIELHLNEIQELIDRKE